MNAIIIFLFVYTPFSLRNGMEVFLKEDHSFPLASAMIVVHSGSFYESIQNLGMTHFLEHLLFDGTTRHTRAELREAFSQKGIYVNAFTREDYTAYFFTAPQEELKAGLTLLSEMLFESTIPEDEFEKEKGVVAQEMFQDRSREYNIHSEFARRVLFSGTPYARPVLGYETTIENTTREKVWNFYKTYYAPNNMTFLAVGDFDSSILLQELENIFGIYPPQSLPEPPEPHSIKFKGRELFYQEGSFKTNHITIAFTAPLLYEKSAIPFFILEELLNTSHNGLEKLKRERLTIQEVNSSYEFYKGTSLFKVSLSFEKIAFRDEIIDAVQSLLKNFRVSLDDFERSKKRLHYDKIYQRENFTYDLMDRSIFVPFGGPSFQKRIEEEIQGMTLKRFNEIFRGWNWDNFRVALSTPEKKLKREEKEKTASIATYKEDSARIIYKHDPQSPIVAVHILVKNRLGYEPLGKSGLSQLVFRLLFKRTSNFPKEELSRKIQELGIRSKTVDNPYIPFDDYYHRKDFAYIRFEVPEENWRKALKILKETLNNALFEPEDIKEEARSLKGIIAQKSNDPEVVAYEGFIGYMFKGTPFEKPLLGNIEDIEKITPDDIDNAYQDYLNPSNLVIGIVSPFKYEKIDLFEKSVRIKETPEIEPVREKFYRNIPLKTPQAYIYIGRAIPEISAPESPAIRLTAGILSKRLQGKIREKMGVSYRLGAGVEYFPGFGIFLIGIGTSPDDVTRVIESVWQEIKFIQEKPPSQEELDAVRNSIWGSHLRHHQSRINQAYYLSLYEYLGSGFEYDTEQSKKLRKVSREDVQLMSKKYLNKEDLSIVVAGGSYE